MNRLAVLTGGCVLVAALAAGCGVEAVTTDSCSGPVPADCTLAVVTSDYFSTSVSLLDDDGALCHEALIGSGCQPPGLVTALSGDVVVPSSPAPSGHVVIIDRFPNSVITFVDPADGVVAGQLDVSTGFASNPHDIAWLAPDKAYVSRHENNPTPTQTTNAASDDFDEGGDLLIVDPAALTVTGRIDLQGIASGPEMWPRPAALVAAGGRVWVGLAHLDGAFMDAGPGLLAAVDPATDTVTDVVQLDGLEDCGIELAPTPSGDALWTTCLGLFARGRTDQVAASGLVRLDLTTDPPTESFRLTATDLGLGQPFGFGVTASDETRAIAVVFGDIDGPPDRVLLVDSTDGSVEELDVGAAAYQLGSAHWVSERGLLLLADADPTGPRVHRLEVLADGSSTALESIDPGPSIGLPPRHISRFRAAGEGIDAR